MIKETRIISQSKYGKYFLSTEADDEEENTPEVHKNTKVISIKPNNRRRIDFTDGAEEPSEEVPDDNQDDSQSEDTEVNVTDDNTDVTTDTNNEEINTDNEDYSNIDDQQQNSENNTDDQQASDDSQSTELNNDQDLADGEPETDNQDYTNDGADQQVNDGSSNEEPTDGPDTSNSEDFTSDAQATDDATQAADAQGDVKKGPGLEYDSTRKYNLFENYISLSNAINNYISKLENNMGDDYEYNLILRTVTDKLKDIYDLCYDYMTMKFEISSYVQSLLFFQNLVIMVQMTFNILEKANKSIKNKNNDIKH